MAPSKGMKKIAFNNWDGAAKSALSAGKMNGVIQVDDIKHLCDEKITQQGRVVYLYPDREVDLDDFPFTAYTIHWDAKGNSSSMDKVRGSMRSRSIAY